MKTVLALLFITNTASAQILLRVRPHIASAPGSEIRLSQLVDGQGLSAESRRKLEETVVAQAPATGEKQEISKSHLTALMRPIVQEERAISQQAVHLVIPKTVTVGTETREMTAGAVEKELLQAWRPLCSDCKMEIESLSLPKIKSVRDWSLRLKAELPRGSFSVAIALIKEDGSETSAWISGRLTVKRKVPVARRLLNAGERAAAEDFVWEYRDTSFALDGAPTEEEIAGKRMRQSLANNQILFRGMLEREKAIRRGDLVQLKSSEGMWEITMSVVAQQDGFIGDTVTFKNPKTNNILMGQVTGQGEVELR